MSTSSWETRGKRSARGKEKEGSCSSAEDEIDSGNEDAVGISRSSARHVAKVISKFCRNQIELVKSIGFGGILHIPHLNKVNRKFSVWLLSRVDVEKGTLLLRDGIHLPLNATNLNKLLGIPCGPKPIQALCPVDEQQFVRCCLGVANGSADGLKEATAIVSRVYPEVMREGDQLVFQSAFVMFIMGHLLAPTTQHDVGMTDFLGSVTEVDEMIDQNWCGYVANQLLNSAKKVQADLKEGKQITYVTGCPLILQFLYLDCMDLGQLNQNHDVFPRIKAFSSPDGPCRLMNQMIQCDTVSSSQLNGEQTFGCCKVRPLDTLCYEVKQYPSIAAREKQKAPKVPQHHFPHNVQDSQDVGPHDLAQFLKIHYGDQLSTPLVDAFKVHNARCLQHLCKLKRSILHENIVLADKVLCDVLMRDNPAFTGRNARTAREDYLSGPESGGEDDVYLRNKRRADSTGGQQVSKYPKHNKQVTWNRASRRGRWNYRSPRYPHHVETILTGSSFPIQELAFSPSPVVPDRANSNSALSGRLKCAELEQHANEDGCPAGSSQQACAEFPEFCAQPFNQDPGTPKQTLPTIAEETPGFDLGIDLTNNDNQHEKDHALMGSAKSTAGAHDCLIAAGTVVDDPSFQTPIQKKETTLSPPTQSPGTSNRTFSTAALFYKITEDEDNINLNKEPQPEEYLKNIERRSVRVGIGRLARSPWEAKLNHPKIDGDLCDSLFDWLSTTTSNDLERPWIIHQTATYIEITGTMMKEHFCLGGPTTFDMFDVAVRRLKQLDTEMYPEGTTIRWRHWLESNFAMHVLAGDDPTQILSIKEQFVGRGIDFEIERCRMFIVPLQSSENWCAYVWDMKRKKVVVLDPSFTGLNYHETKSKHKKTVIDLHEGLVHCFDGFFEGWKGDWANWSNWEIELPKSGCDAPDKGSSGLCTIFLARNFDGAGYSKEPTQEALHTFKRTFLYEVLGLSSNKASLPRVYVHTIHD